MKKILCVMLALIMCASLFAACGGERKGENKEPIYQAPVYDFKNLPDVANIPLVEFTLQSMGRADGNRFLATVDEEYRHIYGEFVNISFSSSDDVLVNVCLEDRLKVTADSVESTTPITVHVKSAELIEGSEYRYTDSNGIVRYKWGADGYDPFTIPTMEKLIAYKTTLTSTENLHDRSYDFSYIESSLDAFYRVCNIQDGVYYLCSLNSNMLRNCLVDYEGTLAIGDMIRVKASGWYSEIAKSQKIFYSENIQSVSKLTEDEIWQTYLEIHEYQAATAAKPVIYLYPEEDTECSVKVTLQNGKLTCTYPEHGENGWQNFTATPDGTLIFPDGKQYYCLYWEGKCDLEPDFTKGACVKGSETAAFLEKALAEMGLSEREANEFIIYWLPILQENPYNLISFQTEAYTSVAELEITPTPDSLLRVYMTAKPLDHYEEIEPQTFDGFERKGFTVIEWGGSIIE